MGRLVKHGSQGVADAPAGGEAKDSFDLGTLPQSEAMDVSKNTALYDKEAVGKAVLTDQAPETVEEGQETGGTPFKEFVESPKGTVLPIEKSGKVEEPIADSDLERFANQGTPDYEGQKESQEDPATMVIGQKTLGHKTKSGL